MNNIEEQLNILKKTAMNPKEKGVIRGVVVSYMQENPIVVRNSGDSRLQYRTSNVNNSLINKKNMTIAIIIALLLGGGTSFAAENALPGDVLYPIKIHVNENVQELVAVSDESEAKVQAKLAGRRLEEAEKLAARGELTAETSAELNLSFEEHSKKLIEHQAKIGEDKNTDALIKINSETRTSLGDHQKIILDLEGSKPEMKGLLDGLLSGVQIHLKEAEDGGSGEKASDETASTSSRDTEERSGNDKIKESGEVEVNDGILNKTKVEIKSETETNAEEGGVSGSGETKVRLGL